MLISERLLHFIWQFQYFNKTELVTADGEPVIILFAGLYNHNQGPDFADAKIVIGNATWAGAVELHIKTSDWIKHGHQHDDNYGNVILHVVWENDQRAMGSFERRQVPVLELAPRVPKVILQRYEEMMQSTAFIPCERSIATVPALTWLSWKERLLAGRLMRKAAGAEECLRQNNYHWEETFWWMLARNFGMKVNGEAFEAIARSLPLAILARHKNQIHQLEALLMGQGNLLSGSFQEDYPLLLQREYRFLQVKYKLEPIRLPLYCLRMRPINFPTVRLAQLAMLVHQSAHLFSSIRDIETAPRIKDLFEVTANDYWHYHYRFDEPSSFKQKRLGISMRDNIIINTVAPLLFAYGSYHRKNSYKNIALLCLEETVAEKNRVTERFRSLGIDVMNAGDSQALLELRSEYCDQKRCLECSVGNAILKQPGSQSLINP